MKQQIQGILQPFVAQGIDAGCDFDGTFWQVWIGRHGGARKDGQKLAAELAELARREKRPRKRHTRPDPMAKAVPVDAPIPIPEFLAEPEAPDPRLDLQAARIAELEAALEAMKKQATDMFDADALADLVRENEPHSEAQRRWQSDYNQLNNRLVDPRLPPLSDAERALLNRLQKALYAGRKGAVGII